MDMSKRTSDLIDQENRHFSKSDEKVPPEISDKVPDAVMDKEVLPEISDKKVSPETSDKVPDNWKHASFDLDDYARGIKPTLKYHCIKCDKKYENVLVLNHHFKITHEKATLFKCKICFKRFQIESNLQRHMTLHHDKHFSPGKKHEKYEGVKVLNHEKKNLKQHVALCHDKKFSPEVKLFRCSQCPNFFDKQSNLNHHMILMHGSIKNDKQLSPDAEKELDNAGKKRYNCSICEKDFGQKSHLKHHVISVHEGKKDHKCPLCEKGFSKKSNLNSHIATVHEGKNKHEALEQKMPKKHAVEKNHFQCSKCPNVYKNEISLNEHMSLMHGSNTNDEKFVGIEDKYQQIGNTVSQPLAKDIGVSIIFAQAETEAENKALPFKCKMCYKSFQIEKNLELHMNFQHGKQSPQAKKLFHCSKCPKFFKKKGYLENHVSLMHLSKKSDENLSPEIKTVKVSYPNAKCAIKDLKRNRRNKEQ